MSHLWMRDELGWAVRPLREDELVDLPAPTIRHASDTSRLEARPQPSLVACPIGDRSVWTVLSPSSNPVLVNGVPVATGIRTLADRDEITIGTASFFYSSEALARIADLPPSEQPILCVRCRQPIEPGSPAVRCPSCALWHHQCESLPCWTHLPECGGCSQPTALDASYRWTPEDL